jgi:hypothetical protein
MQVEQVGSIGVTSTLYLGEEESCPWFLSGFI